MRGRTLIATVRVSSERAKIWRTRDGAYQTRFYKQILRPKPLTVVQDLLLVKLIQGIIRKDIIKQRRQKAARAALAKTN